MEPGISNRDDTNSIKEVIRQVRAARECDVLLLTGAFGGVDPDTRRQWDFYVNLQDPEYRARLICLAKEGRCAYLDMTAHWGKYVLDSGKGVSWFQRDRIHANDYGEQILGRILAAYLLPDLKGGTAKAGDPSK